MWVSIWFTFLQPEEFCLALFLSQLCWWQILLAFIYLQLSLLSFLKTLLTGYRILCVHFSSITFKGVPTPLFPGTNCFSKPIITVILVSSNCNVSLFSVYFQKFYLIFSFQMCDYKVFIVFILLGVHWVSWIYRWYFSSIWGKDLAIITLNMFLLYPLLYQEL